VITRWEENLEDRRLIKHALALYSDVEAAREQQINVADRVIKLILVIFELAGVIEGDTATCKTAHLSFSWSSTAAFSKCSARNGVPDTPPAR